MWIHPSHQPQARRLLLSVALLLLLALLASFWPMPASTRGLASYLPLHSALETLAITLAALIFGLVWSLRREALPRNVLLLGAGFLGVALFDFSHMLSYSGMPDYVTPSGIDKAIAFWLTARFLGALALLAAALPWGRERTRLSHWILLALVLAVVAAVHALVLLRPQWLPPFFEPGQGLTLYKLGCEYALIALNLLTATLLLPHLRRPRQFHTSGLFAAACTMALGEFFFTLYANVTDIYNLLGHLYKALAYFFLYNALFAETVRCPYALLHHSERQLQATLSALPDLLFELDGQGRYLQVHTHQHQALSAPGPQLLGRSVHEAMPAEPAATVLAAIAEARAHGVSHGKTIALTVQNGSRSWFELSVARQAGAPGQEESFLVLSRDVTAREQTEHELHKLWHAVEQSPVTIVITDLQARIQYVNQAFTRSSGYSAAEAQGQNPRLLQSGKTPAGTYRAMWHQLSQGKPWQGEIINRRKDGAEYTEQVHISPVRDAQGQVTHFLAHKEDITERKQAAERIQKLTQHDPLTGLPNRSLLGTEFTHLSQQAKPLAVLWLNIDHFKDVNDALGHHMGDLLLLEITRRLRDHVKGQDLISRHAGDSFIALLPATGEHGAATLAQRLLGLLAQPLSLGAEEISITVSIGIALFPSDGQEFETLLQRAETAMYRAKQEGRNRYQFATASMQTQATRALALGHALKGALAREEFALVYQPQLDLQSGQIHSAEVLLRWHSSSMGAVSPAEFIPLAEASGLIVPMGAWVLHSALRQLRAWLDAGLQPLTLAVNLSGVQFNQPELPAQVAQWLHASGVPPDCLELELTEAVALKNPQQAVAQMQALSRLGVRLAIDDFGTGYSSLSRLKRLAIDKLKIDQSFVQDLVTDPDDQAIATAIIQLARSLGLRTIAEGVETAEQLAWLHHRGCDAIQGYHLSRPLPAAEFEAFVRAHKASQGR